jgi:hypothetical protein
MSSLFEATIAGLTEIQHKLRIVIGTADPSMS